MSLSKKLNRPIRAVEEESDDDEFQDILEGSSPSVLATGDGGDISMSEEDESHDEDEDVDNSDQSDDHQVQKQLSKVSFGALAKAQDALSKQQSANRKRKRDDSAAGQQEDKLHALRERLRELKAQKAATKPTSSKKQKTEEKSSKKQRDAEDEDDSDSSSDGKPAHARSSKHAPAVQSSKRAVTRRRAAIEVKKPVVRDPRFDPLAGPKPDETVLKKRYAFLDEYKASEIAELKETIKKTKNESEKEILKRKLLSMESQRKAQEAKDKKQEIIREHRKKEKELVKEGKQPFFLKKSETKKLALIDKFQSMKPKQREHVIERRRKKVTAKERKNIPMERTRY
jgi:ribosomal RNA-processing protein 36